MAGRALPLVFSLLFLTACTTPGTYNSKPYPGKYPTRYPTEPGSLPAPVEGRAPAEEAGQVAQPQPAPRQEPSDIRPGDSEVAMGAISAVDELLEEAWGYHDDGEFERAIAVAERALRMDRRNAEVYLVMASGNYELYRNDRARQLANQGLAYAERGSATYRRLRDLLDRL